MKEGKGQYILSISIHGLIRAKGMELGRDADTGGQITYVVEQAKALAENHDVDKVDLLTRRVFDLKLSPDYARPFEPISENAQIVRIPCGPRRYVKKEKLWPYLELFVDNTFKYLRSHGRTPDLIHAHYADAGYVGARLASMLDVPLVYTGHSLGRVKRQKLMEDGANFANIESEYHLGQRIEAEERALEIASFVIASTNQEVEEQYRLYDHYDPRRMLIIPPGVDLARFTPPSRFDLRGDEPKIYREIFKFLEAPKKPLVLTIARPDRKKNLTGLIRAYAENKKLQEVSNLLIFAGSRENIAELEKGAKETITEILMLIDKYDLHGKVSYPKKHSPEDIPHIYRLAARSKGLFVNPALNEPFGLTLLEAAASGLPVVATNDGGPMDIQAECKNGFLIDPTDEKKMGEVILDALTDKERWNKWAKSGISGARRRYRWVSHTNSYMKAANKVIRHEHRTMGNTFKQRRLIGQKKTLICDIDGTLVGDQKGLSDLLKLLWEAGEKISFGVASGRSLSLTLQVLKEWKIPIPNILITSVGTEIYYGANLVKDVGYTQHINNRWRPEAIRNLLKEIPGVTLQPPDGQSTHKISYFVDSDKAPKIKEIKKELRQNNIQASVIYSHGMYLDILPIRASKGYAIRYLSDKWDIPLEKIMVAGDSGNDEEMLVGANIGVVVGNHSPELNKIKGRPNVYFVEGKFANGIVEAIEKFRFLEDIDRV